MSYLGDYVTLWPCLIPSERPDLGMNSNCSGLCNDLCCVTMMLWYVIICCCCIQFTCDNPDNYSGCIRIRKHLVGNGYDIRVKSLSIQEQTSLTIFNPKINSSPITSTIRLASTLMRAGKFLQPAQA